MACSLRRAPQRSSSRTASYWAWTWQEVGASILQAKRLHWLSSLREMATHVRIARTAGNEPTYLSHFKQLWTACFRNFRRTAAPGDRIYFTPELLAPDIYYARTFPNNDGVPVEESDRWEQSLILKQTAED